GLGAEVRDAHRLLERQARREDLLEHRADGLRRERSGVGGGEPLDDGALARRHIEGHLHALLQLGDLPHELGSVIQEPEDVVIDGIDRAAQRRKIHAERLYYTVRLRHMKRRTLAVLLILLAWPVLAHAAPSEFEELRAKGLVFAYLGVFATGFLTSLTPCVYPMITITVGIFGAREAQSRWRAFGLAWMYVLGMVVMFSALGIVFALSGRASGSGFLLANPAVVIPIVILYVALAASMFGL